MLKHFTDEQQSKKLATDDMQSKKLLIVCILSLFITLFLPNAGWISLAPPMIAILSAIITQNVIFSLGLAVVIGGITKQITTGEQVYTNIFNAGKSSFGYLHATLTDVVNLEILGFAATTLVMIAVVVNAGGMQGIIQWLIKRINSRKSASFTTFLLGVCIFIDDYANTMIVGASMRSITDYYRISREKLAFIVDATSAPIAGIAIISTWVSYEVGLFTETAKAIGINQNGYSILFDALGYRFYCIFMLIFLVINILSDRDFFTMLTAEKEALKATPKTNKENTAKKDVSYDKSVNIHPLTATLPILSILVFVFIGLWIDGKGSLLLASHSFFDVSFWQTLLSQSENVTLVLLISSLSSLAVAVICSLTIAKLSPLMTLKAILAGIKKSLFPLIVLVLAWSLKKSCDDLETDKFIVQALGDSLSPILFPIILFLISGAMAFSTGTSWGTMAILIPMAIPMAYSLDGEMYGLVTIICCGAILDGAIFGDHCSPVSDTTVLSSISCECDHIQHVKTQAPYALIVAMLAIFIGYFPAGFGMSSFYSIIAVILISILIFKLFGKKAI
jgi:Na+/H+ antiporter NhaC